MIKAKHPGEPVSIGFLLLHDFSMLAFTACIEPIQMANHLSGQTLYQWHVIGVSDSSVKASNGIVLTPEHSIDDAPDLDAVFVCSGYDAQRHSDPRIERWLQRAGQRDGVIGAISTGTYVLAHANVLDGVSCTIHWKYFNGIQRRFPSLSLAHGLFETSGQRYTSAGGITPLDMFLDEIRRAHGQSLAWSIADQCNYGGIRSSREWRRELQARRAGHLEPRLARAIALMEANLTAPLALDELAATIGLSRKRLDELFQRLVKCNARHYYRALRLEHARQLLRESQQPVSDIACATGFASPSHFSRCYKAHYGQTPRSERNCAVAGQSQAGEATGAHVPVDRRATTEPHANAARSAM